jgi:hypothetical protein
MKKFTVYDWSLFMSFSLLSVVGVLNHELWMDEAHHWLIARESTSVVNLFYNMRYEGHPALWNLLLYIITRFTHNPLSMQLLNVFISISAVYVFLRYAPWSKTFKTLFILGYFTLYEYTVISRNYALVMLFLYLIVTLFSQPKKDFFKLGCLLFLLSNTHLFGFIISCAFIISIFIHYSLYPDRQTDQKKRLVPGALVFSIGAVCSFLQFVPPSDSPFIGTFSSLIDLKHFGTVAASFLKAFMPIPDVFQYHYWNTNIVVSFSKGFSSLASLILAFVPLVLLIRRPASLSFFYLSATGILLFIYATGMGSVRYFGFLYFLLITALWLAMSEPEHSWYNKFKLTALINKLDTKISKQIIMTCLVLQVIGGVMAYTLDLQKPFSTGKNVADYIKNNGYNGYSLVTFNPPTPAICSYLENSVYQLNTQTVGTYMHWASDYEIINEDRLLIRAVEYAKTNGKGNLLIAYLPIQPRSDIAHHFELLKSFENSVIRNENFWLYKIKVN